MLTIAAKATVTVSVFVNAQRSTAHLAFIALKTEIAVHAFTFSEQRFAGRDELREQVLTLCRQARREVLILSHQLDPYSYNRIEVYEALKQLALRSPKASVRILLQDNEPVRRSGHRLLELAQRLSSRVLIHRPHLQEHRDLAENLLVVDETGYLRQPIHSRPEGSAACNQRGRARELAHQFETIWQQSEPDSLLRRLSI